VKLRVCAGSTVFTVIVAASRAGAEPSAVPDQVAPTRESAEAPESNWTVPTVHALGVMTGMRIGEAIIWPEPFADLDPDRIGKSYEYAYTHAPRWDSDRDFFEWDGDPWAVNAIGHALFGSELYLRARTCHNGPLPALAFTALGSVLWEYGFEANGAQPSALDLVYTPAAGIAFGELRYLGWQAASRLGHRTWRGVLKTVLDPLGEFERAPGTVC
jgi:uncharacterized protein DUF3943